MKPEKSGNELDAAQLIREHQAGVWRYLRVLGCSRELAEDLTQETFLAVLEQILLEYLFNLMLVRQFVKQMFKF